MNFDVINLGRTDYKLALDFQYEMLEKRQKNEIKDTLILTEHNPVLTLGIRGNTGNILIPPDIMEKENVKVYEINRGGDVTYHGPGQVVGYPIFSLETRGKNIKQFVYMIEEVFISLLKYEYNIKATREEKKYTGVWVNDSKITAIGIAVKHWVTMHGFAFNANTDLSHFKWINPCGITDRGVTSLEKLTGSVVDFSYINKKVEEYFIRIFGGHDV